MDAVARARRIRAATFGGIPGFILGAVAGLYAWGPLGALVLGCVLATVIAGTAYAISEGVGSVAGALLHPRADRRRKDHSRARALLVRGELDAALAELEGELVADPGDLEACLLAARSCREAGRMEEAVQWFKRARGLAETEGRGEWAGIVRELVDLLDHRMGQGPRAAPELARLAEHHAGNEHGEWARSRLAEIKAAMRGDVEHGGEGRDAG